VDRLSLAYPEKEFTVIEAKSVLASGAFSREFESEIEEALKERGIKLLLNERVEGFLGRRRVERVVTSGGEVEADLVFVFIGFVPNTALAVEAGIETERGFIKVDDFMRTSKDSILAAGNCILHTCPIDGQKVPIMLASVSARDGRLAGANVCGPEVRDEGVVPSGVTGIGERLYGFSGYTEESLKAKRIDFKSVLVSSFDAYPSAMKGCRELKLKLYFSPKGNLLGGELRGESKFVAPAVELISQLIKKRVTAYGLLGEVSVAFPPATPPPLLQPLQEGALRFLRGEF